MAAGTGRTDGLANLVKSEVLVVCLIVLNSTQVFLSDREAGGRRSNSC